jgi:hypothetical protein
MKALMMNMTLMISSLIVNAGRHHGGKGIISRLTEGGLHRHPCANAHKRLRRLADAPVTLSARGARPRNGTGLEQHAWI